MKTPFLLCLLLIAPLAAKAESLQDTLQSIESIRSDAEKDIDFVYERAPNCTAGDKLDKLRELALKPARARIRNYGEIIADTYSHLFLGDNEECHAPSPMELRKALRAVDRIADDIAEFQEKMASKSAEAMYLYTYDELMFKAMAADDNYPKCRMQKAGDVNSTPESLRYQTFKRRLAELADSLENLKSRTRSAAKTACKGAEYRETDYASYAPRGSGMDHAVDQIVSGQFESN
jgi:hypothetical protein